MVKALTKGIEISVETFYLAAQSRPGDNHFFFVYEITIENKNDFSIQLLRRHWDIFDSSGEYRVVDGEGVVGETPIIEPGEKFTYNSGCNLTTEIGRMSGTYIFNRLIDNREFLAHIPTFNLITPGKLN